MRFVAISVQGLAMCFLAGCLAGPPDASITLDDLANASCPEDAFEYEPAPLDLLMTPVPLGPEADVAKMLPASVKFVGGWHLTSKDNAFGGLSGIELLQAGQLLVVSDKGYFITLEPGENKAVIMPLLDDNGKSLVGKISGDAEGLAEQAGLIFVSFENNHRILAYNFEGCGASAQGVFFADSPEKILRTKLGRNDGAESLDVTPQGHIRAGYEMIVDGASPLITFEKNGEPMANVEFAPTNPDFHLVGADEGFLLFRAYDPKKGNRNIIRGPDIEFKLAPPLNVDNFEGIAAEKTKSGLIRIYLISDDNYSNTQRTLLYVFEISD